MDYGHGGTGFGGCRSDWGCVWFVGSSGDRYYSAITSRAREVKPDNCADKAGKTTLQNYTVGYSRVNPATSTDAQVLNEVVGPLAGMTNTKSCVDGCFAVVQDGEQGWGSTSQSAQGLYRLSVDYRVAWLQGSMGGACVQDKEDRNNPVAPVQPCDGAVGQVNGELKCIAPAGTGNVVTSERLKDPKQGNPAAGSDGSKSIGDPTRTPPPGSQTGGSSSSGGSGTAGDGGNGGGPGRSTDGQRWGSGAGSPNGAASSAGNGTSGKDQAGGKCADNPSAAGCGGSAASVTGNYTGKDKQMSTVIGDFKDKVLSSPFGSATTGFFSVSGGGACPRFSAPNPLGGPALVIDQFCTSLGTNMLAIIKTVLLVVASWMAFRVAIDN